MGLKEDILSQVTDVVSALFPTKKEETVTEDKTEVVSEVVENTNIVTYGRGARNSHRVYVKK